jgi:hypothetical protein
LKLCFFAQHIPSPHVANGSCIAVLQPDGVDHHARRQPAASLHSLVLDGLCPMAGFYWPLRRPRSISVNVSAAQPLRRFLKTDGIN